MVAPLRLIPVGLVVVRVPPQTAALALATVSPAGRVSLKPTPVSATALGLLMLKVRELVVLSGIEVGLKALAIEGGARTTMLAEATPPVPASIEVTAPVLLNFAPAVVPVTLTEKVQPAAGAAARVAPLRLMLPEPATAVIVPPPQAPDRPWGLATARPAARLSVKPAPPKEARGFGSARGKVSGGTPPIGVERGPQPLP